MSVASIGFEALKRAKELGKKVWAVENDDGEIEYITNYPGRDYVAYAYPGGRVVYGQGRI